jgi:hypothetical protein
VKEREHLQILDVDGSIISRIMLTLNLTDPEQVIVVGCCEHATEISSSIHNLKISAQCIQFINLLTFHSLANSTSTDLSPSV